MIVTEGEDVMAPDSGRLQRVRHSGARLRRAQARKNRRGTAAGDQQQRPKQKPRHHLLEPFSTDFFESAKCICPDLKIYLDKWEPPSHQHVKQPGKPRHHLLNPFFNWIFLSKCICPYLKYIGVNTGWDKRDRSPTNMLSSHESTTCWILHSTF